MDQKPKGKTRRENGGRSSHLGRTQARKVANSQRNTLGGKCWLRNSAKLQKKSLADPKGKQVGQEGHRRVTRGHKRPEYGELSRSVDLTKLQGG